ncbi:Dihydrodipicolinate synthase family protein (plasmid) [Roseomonas mucosa]|uniref:Dihydrodipicolinate synthase n=1 Tax=Roseomonas mucosa TaxID=207340 RepID=A0A1S8D422_9PROT|nr:MULTISPECIES: dihydrodipicolinate synthase family protein [Roseomonas]MBS5904378.1 dihydrodipicolinate synthase family protein [Acetobacteraceae bacterium]ATR19003.1 dihydrodipicolinate synthase family protein [Roseomonas sp. FDAARGOS_362]MCG7351247.1 dihydrodipicolinate synthase family protein [Roseomonas mucosa]MCG7356685.1 dihydrodipicolinate synthase family protein [Roseomonas mucosa]MDT8291320.1 dihydrodipicolinate synthase family protein [Roseomonas mucosa]
MASYTRVEAREWARERLIGAINCTIPSFSSDLKRINERAIRHDTRLAIEHGFMGSLAVSEVSITLPEYLDFMRIMKDEAGDRLVVTHHASWNTLEENIEALKGAEEAGAEFVLLSYPPAFYPESENEIYEYTKAICDATNLAVMIFPMYLWGFYSRIHPSDIPASLIRRLIDDCPNLAAIKAEGGFPSIQSVIECHRLFGKEVVISMPIEGELIPLSQLMPIQLSATSDHEYYGPTIPKVMQLLRAGEFDEATRIYWQLHSARKIKGQVAQQMHGGHFINRYVWKFQGWLQGYNGGPLRMPTQRIHDPQMISLRKGLVEAGLNPSMDPFREFFIGRNPI